MSRQRAGTRACDAGRFRRIDPAPAQSEGRRRPAFFMSVRYARRCQTVLSSPSLPGMHLKSKIHHSEGMFHTVQTKTQTNACDPEAARLWTGLCRWLWNGCGYSGGYLLPKPSPGHVSPGIHGAEMTDRDGHRWTRGPRAGGRYSWTCIPLAHDPMASATVVSSRLMSSRSHTVAAQADTLAWIMSTPGSNRGSFFGMTPIPSPSMSLRATGHRRTASADTPALRPGIFPVPRLPGRPHAR